MSTHDRGQCRQCNTFDPIHAKRSRQRGRGATRPASVADVMLCPNCGHEWVERTPTWREQVGSE